MIKTNALEFAAGLFGIATKVERAIRPSAFAASDAFYKQVVINVNKIGKKTGNLRRSIYQVYSESASSAPQGGKQVYHISWNWRTAPHGGLVEFGHFKRYATYFNEKSGKWVTDKSRPLPAPVRVAARPFIRPAYTNALGQAENAALARFDQLTGLRK